MIRFDPLEEFTSFYAPVACRQASGHREEPVETRRRTPRSPPAGSAAAFLILLAGLSVGSYVVGY